MRITRTIRHRLGCVLMVLLLCPPVAISAEWGQPLGPHYTGPEVKPRPISPANGTLSEEERRTIAVFKEVSPSVVFITNAAIQRDPFSLNLFEVPQGNGSGFIWNTSGHIITNFHVIYGADTIHVVLADHKEYPARVVGVAPDYDLAVIQVNAPKDKLHPIPVGDAKALEVGQKVLAIGNPFGLDWTLTTGVVSALGRTIVSMTGRTIRGAVQTDAAINPGNSGGPLLDSFGRLIGVNTSIISPAGASVGVGFAVPVNIVNRVVPQLIQYGRIMRPTMGLVFVPEQVAASWGIEGLVVYKVAPGGPAQKAGLRGTRVFPFGKMELGDIIKTIDGKPVLTVDDVLDILDQHKPGDRLVVEYERDGIVHKTTITLGEPKMA